MEMDFLMQKSQIPKFRQKSKDLIPEQEDLKAFKSLDEIKTDIQEFVTHGENLYLFSKNFGNGKTSWAIKLMLSYFDKIWAGNGFRVRGLFVHVPTFLTKLKNNISQKDIEFEQLRNNLLTVDLVVWDDIASTNLGEYDHANLLTYIDQRILCGLSNIYTGNLNKQDLPISVGNRLASRIWNESGIIELKGFDRRGDYL